MRVEKQPRRIPVCNNFFGNGQRTVLQVCKRRIVGKMEQAWKQQLSGLFRQPMQRNDKHPAALECSRRAKKEQVKIGIEYKIKHQLLQRIE